MWLERRSGRGDSRADARSSYEVGLRGLYKGLSVVVSGCEVVGLDGFLGSSGTFLTVHLGCLCGELRADYDSYFFIGVL